MIRFLDLRGHDIGDCFAFYDTVTDKFLEFSGSQTWGSFTEFAEDFHGSDELFARLNKLILWPIGNL